MERKYPKNYTYTAPYPYPHLCFPDLPQRETVNISPKRASIFEYYTISDGSKRVYTDVDRIPDYKDQKILKPKRVSYMNLYINGVLQPSMNYVVTTGKLILLTEDTPIKGVPIILQMIKL